MWDNPCYLKPGKNEKTTVTEEGMTLKNYLWIKLFTLYKKNKKSQGTGGWMLI